MALTITAPEDTTAAYNPIIIQAVSDVRDNFTFGAAKTISSVSSSSTGYINLNFSAAHGLLKGDYVWISSAPGLETLEDKFYLILAVVDSDTVTIAQRFNSGLTSNGTAYKYIKNYNAFLKFYVYTADAPTTPKYAANKNIKPTFEAGYCVFNVDVSDLVRQFTYKSYTAADVLPGVDFWPIGATDDVRVNESSFVKWGYELSEGFDNPLGGVPVYDADSEVS
jgi:hypothetical protein